MLTVQQKNKKSKKKTIYKEIMSHNIRKCKKPLEIKFHSRFIGFTKMLLSQPNLFYTQINQARSQIFPSMITFALEIYGFWHGKNKVLCNIIVTTEILRVFQHWLTCIFKLIWGWLLIVHTDYTSPGLCSLHSKVLMSKAGCQTALSMSLVYVEPDEHALKMAVPHMHHQHSPLSSTPKTKHC